MMTSHTLRTLLTHFRDLGLEDIILDVPQNRFDAIEDTLDFILPTSAPRVSLPQISRPTPSLTPTVETTQNTRELVAKTNTLDDLRALMESFEGCSLKSTATRTVFSDGNPNAKIMLIGEAPGAEEDAQGLPFVGLSGQLLDKMFGAIGLNRQESLYITNVIPWRPPGNRQPTPQETTLCMPFLERHIELIAPNYIIMVGGTATKALLGNKDGIMRLRGQWQEYQTPRMNSPIKAMPIFHPAYLLRSPGQKRLAWEDLLFVKRELGR